MARARIHTLVGTTAGRSPVRLSAAGFSPRASLARLVPAYWRAFQRERMPRIAVFAILLVLSAAAAIYLIELGREESSFSSFGDAIWFSIVTMTTVGYGDFVPRSSLGRMIAVVLMVVGMALLSLFTATVASILVTEKIRKERGLEVIGKMRDHALICGWNEHGERVLEALVDPPGQEVVLINELPEAALNDITLRFRGANIGYVYGDPALEAVLDRANARYAKNAIVLADTTHGIGNSASDERTTLMTLAVKSVRSNIKVTAEALDLKSEPHLRRAGADDIVITGEFNGFLLASASLTPGMSDVVRSLLSRLGGGLRREPIPSDLVGRTFGELFHALRSRQGFLALAIVTESKGITLDDLLTDDHSLVDQFIKQQFRDAGADFLRAEDRGVSVVVNPQDSYVIGEHDAAIGISRPT